MASHKIQAALQPPLQRAWTAPVDLYHAVSGDSAIYGVTGAGKVVALNPSNGTLRWMTDTVHLRDHLTVMGGKLFCYKKDDGLAIITDNGNSYTEAVPVAINPLREVDPVSNVLVQGDMVCMTINEALLVLAENGDLLTGTAIGNQHPHTLIAVGDGRFAVVDGFGQPQVYTLNGSTLSRAFYTTLPSPGTTQKRRPTAFAGGVLVTGANGKTAAFDVATGAVRWLHEGLEAEALVVSGGTVYAVGPSAHVWAINMADGSVLWRRMYMNESTRTSRVGAAIGGAYLYVTAYVADGGPIHLFALRSDTGSFEWQASNLVFEHGLGLPCIHGQYVIPYGTSQPAVAMISVPAPKLTVEHCVWSPNPLRGARTDFAGTLTLNLPVGGTVTVTAVRERDGAGARLVNRSHRSAGQHTIPWNAGEGSGYSADNQFGRMTVDFQEDGGPSYTVARLIPVNSLPDLLGHWARASVEAMLYHKHIGGYPDLTFKPDNLVTRAESSTIIAKTLGLEGPPAGFQTKFTDISGHWARQYITALEEKGVIGGFLESDGTFTFRPDLQMTRAQEARIVVKAYNVAPAPAGFQTKFTDTAGHWAEADVDALEAAGYVSGFREPDGTFTYRPEQNLTRAELCTMVVRVLNLTRG